MFQNRSLKKFSEMKSQIEIDRSYISDSMSIAQSICRLPNIRGIKSNRAVRIPEYLRTCAKKVSANAKVWAVYIFTVSPKIYPLYTVPAINGKLISKNLQRSTNL